MAKIEIETNTENGEVKMNAPKEMPPMTVAKILLNMGVQVLNQMQFKASPIVEAQKKPLLKPDKKIAIVK